MKASAKLFIGLFVICLLPSCSPFNNGDKILIVEIVGKDSKDVSEESLIKEAMNNGGQISLNVEVIRKIEPQFDGKYTVSDSKGKFIIKPAILNYIGGQGWNLLGPGLDGYYFTKRR